MFFHVVDCVGWGQDFGLVDIVDAEGFEDLEWGWVRMLVGGRWLERDGEGGGEDEGE